MLLTVVRSGCPELLKTDRGNRENCFMVPKIGKASQMRVHPLSDIVLYICIGVERELIFENEEGHIRQ